MIYIIITSPKIGQHLLLLKATNKSHNTVPVNTTYWTDIRPMSKLSVLTANKTNYWANIGPLLAKIHFIKYQYPILVQYRVTIGEIITFN